MFGFIFVLRSREFFYAVFLGSWHVVTLDLYKVPLFFAFTHSFFIICIPPPTPIPAIGIYWNMYMFLKNVHFKLL